MEYSVLYAKTVAELRRLAREQGIRLPASITKAEICDRMLEAFTAREAAAVRTETHEPIGQPAAASGTGGVERTAGEPEGAERPTERPMRRQPTAPRPAERPAQTRTIRTDMCPAEAEPVQPSEREPAQVRPAEPTARAAMSSDEATGRRVPARVRGEQRATQRTANEARPDSEGYPDGAGMLDILPDGYGYLRADYGRQSDRDIYISIAQIRRFNLKQGDLIEGKVRPPREGDRYGAIIFVSRVNGCPPEAAIRRRSFESLTPLYPQERLRLSGNGEGDPTLRLIDLLAPIGKGQRGMIVSQPKAGKTTILKRIANAISDHAPECRLIVLLIDERPEEVTDMRRSIRGDVIYSTFDEAPENHVRMTELVLEHAQRMVEMGQDVVILMDSITRLARAYNLVIPPTGRSLSGGLDPGALYKPKRFFGAARNIENGGSLTIIATALVETGSRMDDIIFEEFKGTGNMELHLDRKLSERRIFPAIDLLRSGTRREELLLSPEELEASYIARRLLSGGNPQQGSELLLGMVEKTTTNEQLCTVLKGMATANRRDGGVSSK